MSYRDEHTHPWVDAAVEAELSSGKRESSAEDAKSHILVRLARMSIGTVVLLVGLAAMVGPGPGLLIVALGLSILARDVAWADRLLQRVRDRLPSDDDGSLPRSTVVTMTLMTLAALAASVWWFFIR
jgi:hypothetical protein